MCHKQFRNFEKEGDTVEEELHQDTCSPPIPFANTINMLRRDRIFGESAKDGENHRPLAVAFDLASQDRKENMKICFLCFEFLKLWQRSNSKTRRVEIIDHSESIYTLCREPRKHIVSLMAF